MSAVVRVLAVVVLAGEALAILGLYVISMVFAGGIGPQDPGTETVSTSGARVFATAVVLPPAAVWALAAAAVLRGPAEGWKRTATLLALGAITLGNVILTVLSITAGHMPWMLILGAATAVLSAAMWQLFSSPRNRRTSSSRVGSQLRAEGSSVARRRRILGESENLPPGFPQSFPHLGKNSILGVGFPQLDPLCARQQPISAGYGYGR
ncbi:hypothetical protein [Nesterenkonia sp. CF4.4]|uniref:hypothetical protein n=1 Tax=Nesterenkonia sp. CF4.4 TaxID=3373079 RepID=UPI003EE73646